MAVYIVNRRELSCTRLYALLYVNQHGSRSGEQIETTVSWSNSSGKGLKGPIDRCC